MKKIVFLHPALRKYRFDLFAKLGEVGIDFLFTSYNPIGTHSGNETQKLLGKFPSAFKQADEKLLFGYKNFSKQIFSVFKYDAVIFSCMTSIPFLLLSLPLKLLGKKIILYEEMWVYPSRMLSYALLWPFARLFSLFCVDLFICTGSKAFEFLNKGVGVKRKKIYIAYNTAPSEGMCIQASRAFRDVDSLKNTSGVPIFLYLGRIVYYKGLDILIKAVSMLEENVIVLVVGDGPYRSYCESLAKELGVFESFVFLGECESEESSFFYQISDCFVLPSRFVDGVSVGHESWGFTVNEAMMAGLPVISSTAVGAAHDLIVNNKTGYVFEQNSHIELSEAIDNFLCLHESKLEMGSEAKAWVERCCSYEQNVEVFCEVINKIKSS